MSLPSLSLRAVVATSALAACLSARADDFTYLPSNVLSVEECTHAGGATTVIGDVQLEDSVRAFAWTKSGALEIVGTLGTESQATAVSHDGSVVVGAYVTAGGQERALVWTDAEGTVDIGDLGGSYVIANDVSANGNIIVGAAENETGHLRAFRATLDQALDGNLPGLGTLGGNQSEALFVSADGQTVVGRAQVENGAWHLFRWTDGNMVDLGTLGGMQVDVRDISDDARVIVGAAQNAEDLFVPFVWTQTTGLVRVPGVGNVGGAVELVSDDGSFLYGQASIGGAVRKAFRLSLPDLTLLQLGSLFKQRASLVSSASVDGSVVGGQSFNNKGRLEAFLRAEESTPPGFLKQGRLLPLQRVLKKVFGPQTVKDLFFVDVPCISADGHTLIVEARKAQAKTFIHVQIDDYPVIDDGGERQVYFDTRPLKAEIEQYMNLAFDNATLMAEANASSEVASYVALYADYALQYQTAAASLKLNGRNDAKVRALYASYRYYALQMTYYAYIYTYYYLYLPSFGTADYAEETLEALYQSYYYQNLDLEDLMDD